MSIKPSSYDPTQYPPFAVTVDLTIFTLRDGVLHVLLVERDEEPYQGYWALPGGFTRLEESTEQAAVRKLREETGVTILTSLNDSSHLHLEQVKTYSQPNRDPRMRVVSVAYMALAPHLPEPEPVESAAQARWWAVEDLLGNHPEADLAFDHRQILEDALERVRAKLEYTTIATTFLEEPFTLNDLWRVYGAVWGSTPLLSNFRRKVLSVDGFVKLTEEVAEGGPGPKAKLYRAGDAKTVYPPLRRE